MGHEQDVMRKGEQALGATALHLRRDTGHEMASEYEFWNGKVRDLVATIPTGKPVSMREWLVKHDGQQVFTLQTRVDAMSQEVRNVWTPGARLVEAAMSRTKFIEPGGDAAAFSIREYRGVRALRSSEDSWVGYDPLFNNVIAYTVVPA